MWIALICPASGHNTFTNTNFTRPSTQISKSVLILYMTLLHFQMADADSETLSSPLLPAGKQRRPPTTTGIWRWRREALAGSGVVGRGAAAGAMRMRLRSLLAAAVAVTVCALVFTSGLLSRDGLVDSRSPSPLRGFGDALNRASSSFAGIGRGTIIVVCRWDNNYQNNYGLPASTASYLRVATMWNVIGL